VTTSMEVTRAEIARFLNGSEQSSASRANGRRENVRAAKCLSLTRYSYVSLFGLNSLDDMNSSLFENMEWLDQDATDFAQRGKAGARALAARKETFRIGRGPPLQYQSAVALLLTKKSSATRRTNLKAFLRRWLRREGGPRSNRG
jgi:hypothetical protein